MSTTATTTTTHGQFVWHELMVPDVEAAKRFYGGLFGWEFKTSNVGGTSYTEIYAGKQALGGMMALPLDNQIPPHWMGYVSVPDVDAAAAAAAAAGGKVLVSPTDIPNVGRFSVITDPQGGAITPFKSATPEYSTKGQPGPNTFCWDQLNVSDVGAVKDFYAKVVGWELSEMGGGMWTFSMGDCQEASAVLAPPGVPGHWVCYVAVEDLPGTRARAQSLGGDVLLEHMVIPNIGSISVLKDPQGAVICLFGDSQM